MPDHEAVNKNQPPVLKLETHMQEVSRRASFETMWLKSFSSGQAPRTTELGRQPSNSIQPN